ncbi:MAG: glycosyltransferase family 4 protein [Synergistaceae bacterium]|nr:glycosyltransferase family 4 protein [Synergistaceae bacterium]
MNILHISTYLQGGAGRVICDLASAQKRSGNNVSVAINDQEYPGYVNYPEYVENLTALGIDIVKSDGLFKRDVYQNINAAQTIHKLLADKSIDLIHSHAAVPSLAALLGRNNINRYIPVIQTMHGWGLNKNQDHEKMDIVVLNLVDKVVAVSKSDKDLLIGKGVSNQIEIIYNGIKDNTGNMEHKAGNAINMGYNSTNVELSVANVGNIQGNIGCGAENVGLNVRNTGYENEKADDSHEVQRLKKLLEQENERILIGCIGSICKRKNQELILKRLPLVQDVAQFVFIGEDDENIIANSVHKNDVCHLGYVSDANKYISSFDYLILPSRSEGLSLVILESLMSSTPVIVSDLPSFKECITDGQHGFIFKDNDEDSIVSAIKKAVDIKQGNESLYCDMKKWCRLEYENRFTFNEMMKKYNILYHSFTKSKRALTNSCDTENSLFFNMSS